jgi:circadian clock protein KaiC
VLTIPAVELEPDQIAYRIKQAIEEYNVRRVVIDGVLELEIACRSDGRSRNFTSALDSYFKKQRISPLYTYTISKLIGPELDLSDTVFTVLAENLILLRQLAYQSRLYRVISVLKMRDSTYDLSIREFTIKNEVGISVLQPFQSDTELLESLTQVLPDPPSEQARGETQDQSQNQSRLPNLTEKPE